MVAVVDAQPLVDAITEAITAQGLAVGDGEKPAAAVGRPYVVAWFDSGTVEDRSMRSRDGFSLVGSFQVYGFDPDSVRWAVGKLRAAVLGLHRASVTGRNVLMPEHLAGPPMSRDNAADPPLWWQVDEWRLRTSPA